MDYRDSADEAAFRKRLRNWLPERSRDFAAAGDDYRAKQAEWRRARYRAGSFGLSWPREYGGRELPPPREPRIRALTETAGSMIPAAWRPAADS